MKVLDLFSGIGGFSLGLERAGFETAAFCEIDKKCHKVLRKHWADVPIFEDVKTLKREDINETIDIICGGFPCQDLSLAGKGAGLGGERSGLWWEMHRLIQEFNPKACIIENVSALRTRGLDTVLRSLAEIGYDAEWHCITASAVGAPHRRDRIWIVAYPNNAGDRTSECDTDGQGQTTQQRREEFTQSKSSRPCETDTDSHGINGRSESQQPINGGGETVCHEPSRVGSEVAYPDTTGREGWIHRWADAEREGVDGYLGRCSAMDGQPIQNWWQFEPELGRVAHGIPNRIHRLRQLGNSVVPQIPYLLGKAVMAKLIDNQVKE